MNEYKIGDVFDLYLSPNNKYNKTIQIRAIVDSLHIVFINTETKEYRLEDIEYLDSLIKDGYLTKVK